MRLRPIAATVAGVAFAAVVSCGVPATVETVARTIEDAGRDLQESEGVETELEALFESDGPWVLLLIPRTGLNLEALVGTSITEAARARLAQASAGRSGSQHLVQIRRDAVLTRPLAADAVKVEKQLVVSGQGPAWLAVTLKKTDSRSPALLVSFSISTAGGR